MRGLHPNAPDAATPPRGTTAAPPAPRKLSYKEQRELEALPERIDALERELADLRAALGDGTIYRTDPARAQARAARLPLAEAELEAAVDRWAALEERAAGA